MRLEFHLNIASTVEHPRFLKDDRCYCLFCMLCIVCSLSYCVGEQGTCEIVSTVQLSRCRGLSPEQSLNSSPANTGHQICGTSYMWKLANGHECSKGVPCFFLSSCRLYLLIWRLMVLNTTQIITNCGMSQRHLIFYFQDYL